MTFAERYRRARIGTGILLALVVLALVAATTVLVTVTRRLHASGGLHASYWTGNSVGDRGLVLETIDADVSRELLQRRARTLKHQPFDVEWHGYLVVPDTRRYRFAVPADDTASFFLDGRFVVSHEMPTGSRAFDLSRGLHRLRLLYRDYGGEQDLGLAWATETGVFTRVPQVLFVPEIPYSQDIRLRRLVVAVNPFVPWCWWALLWLGVGWVVRQSVARLSDGPAGRQVWCEPGAPCAQRRAVRRGFLVGHSRSDMGA